MSRSRALGPMSPNAFTASVSNATKISTSLPVIKRVLSSMHIHAAQGDHVTITLFIVTLRHINGSTFDKHNLMTWPSWHLPSYFLSLPEITRPHPFPTHVAPYIIHYSKKPVATLPHSFPLKMRPDG